MSAGITLRSFSEDMVPPYYEHLYRIKAGKSISEWDSMSGKEKALAIAVMQIDNSVQGHQAEAEIKRAQQQTRK